MTEPQRHVTAKQGSLHVSLRLPEFEWDYFEPDFWRARHAITGQAAGRGQTFFISTAGQRYALRRFHRGGIVGRLIRDSYFWMGSEATRPFSEFRMTDKLHRAGLPVPVPLAAGYQRNGLIYTGSLLTEFVANSESIDTALRNGRMTDAAWQQAGSSVGRLHAYGFCHADLNPRNIVIDAAEVATIIDLDRGCIRPAGAWRSANLARLQASTTTVARQCAPNAFTQAQWTRFMMGYETAMPRAERS
jgi:3-deoxy-D-manno-octulosonic acid kinase